MKSSWSLGIAAAVIILFLVYLSSSGKKPPMIPADAVHAGMVTNESCTPCHGAGKKARLKGTHPPKEQCVICHKAGKR